MPRDAADVETWLLPGDLARTVREGRSISGGSSGAAGRLGESRTVRDWAVDGLVFTASVLVWALELLGLAANVPVPGWLLVLDLIAGAVMCAAMWWRRRFPIAVGLLACVVGAVSNSAVIPVLVAFFSLAVHRGWRWGYGLVVVAQVLALPHLLSFVPDGSGGVVLWVASVTLLLLLSVTAGLMVRARRQLVWVLADREREARAQRAVEVEAARDAERARIAREMHDVLAHRLSLLAVHANALEYRIQHVDGAAPSPEDLADSIAVIGRSARLSLEELREVLHLAQTPGGGTDPPSPTLSSVPALVEEARSAGQRVELDMAGVGVESVAASAQRAVFRVVQEGLTNARKHAPGSAVLIQIGEDPRSAVLTVRVTNPLVPGVSSAELQTPELPGAGSGLVGLAQRLEVLQGALTHEVVEGVYVLCAWVPTRQEPGSLGATAERATGTPH